MTNPDNSAIYHQVHQRMGPFSHLDEKILKGEEMTGREIASLKPREHIFVKGKHAVVVDVSVKGLNVELIYVKGRKAFGREIYMDIPYDDRRTGILRGIMVDPGNVFLPDEPRKKKPMLRSRLPNYGAI